MSRNETLARRLAETKRQRDRLVEVGKGLLELSDYEYEPAQLANQIARGDLCPVAKDRLDDLRAAIAACDDHAKLVNAVENLGRFAKALAELRDAFAKREPRTELSKQPAETV